MNAGLDEAGRGPLIGPMFMALCVSSSPGKLIDLGVADSKSFGSGEGARRARRRICFDLFSHCEIRWIQVPAAVIDVAVAVGPGLNELERQAALSLLGQVRSPARIVADGKTLFSPLMACFPQMIAVNGADRDYPEVAAASIVAKTFRDDWMLAYERFARSRGFDLRGGGYPNAPTRTFIQAWETRYKESPPHLRKSWNLKQRQLELF
jgi:ribonuclease HII